MEREEGLSIIIPAYNEAEGIPSTLDSLLRALESFPAPWELIVVDDGSSDSSPQLLEGYSGLKRIRHSRNRGYGAAIKTGLREARYAWTGILDADGSYPVESLLDLFTARGGMDMVVGARTGEEVTYSRLRSLPKALLRRSMSWIAREPIPDMNSGLRIFRTELALHYRPLFPDGFSFTTTITMALLCNGYEVRYLPINYYPRKGKSHIQPVRDTLRFLRLIVMMGVLFAPMRVFGPIIAVHALGFGISLVNDVFFQRNLADTTVLLFTATLNLSAFSALAEMIRKYREIS